MNVTRIITGTAILLAVSASSVFAQETTPTVTLTQAVTPTTTSQKERMNNLRNQIKEEREQVRTKIQNIRSTVKSMRGRPVHINGALVKSITGSTLTISKDSKDYTITTSASTKFRRRFWGVGTLSDIVVGHTVNVWGKWADDAQTTIDARLIRDTSVQKRKGAFIGTVKSKDATSFVLSSKLRGDQTILYDANTKFVNRKNVIITSSDISVGDRVRVKGLWDRVSNKVTQVMHVKDYSLPGRTATGTPSATVTMTPAAVTSTP